LDTGRIVAELKRERDRLSRAIAALEGQSSKPVAIKSAVPHLAIRAEKNDHLTPAGRKRLSELMKKRWAEKRKKGSEKRR
jgi:hypothetical protein